MNRLEQRAVREPLLEAREMEEIELVYPEGMSSAEIVSLFERRGVKLSEATFRKYVQLGLLPRSRRVGTKGKHKGSRGVYPAGIVRQINEIKRMMSLNYTIEEIRQHFAFVGGEIEELRVLLNRILERFDESLNDDGAGFFSSVGIHQDVEGIKSSAEALLEDLEDLAMRIRDTRQTEREAV
ncbi:MAG: hypothetical protein MUC50_07355 [Myxococcota bacterium]|jgi:CRISPR type IV-associated protein Csf3|nr:hypothetical protein [Myxococcota bacterium]